MRYGTARLLLKNVDALRVVASAARISTGQGNALDIYEKSGDREKDLKLTGKVLASGHKSVIEHQTFSIAFNDVSVLVEQFVIEFRLASFTVKSRRYVDFSDAGYVVPEGLSPAAEALYSSRANALFELYDKLLALGIPKEDARFVLPYGFRSNFYVTLNARELIHMIAAMLCGRGSAFPEIAALGRELKAQFDELYPGIVDAELKTRPEERIERKESPIHAGEALSPEVTIVSSPAAPMRTLLSALDFSGRFDDVEEDTRIPALLRDPRPRELELLQYAFRIDHVSLACVTHFTRHRMLSLMLHHELSALSGGNYVLPESIKAMPEALALYTKAFKEQTATAIEARILGADDNALAYFALAGHTTSILISMNARELNTFARLRSCSRAQWEIRGIARALLSKLNQTEARPLFKHYGPTCAVTGKCPEGRMSCGHPVRIVDGEWTQREEHD